ncbi:MAG: hypothetical protein LKM38_25795 [Pseudomonas veronii]|nr:hypothetical protein [Pseudomonas veronii]
MDGTSISRLINAVKQPTLIKILLYSPSALNKGATTGGFAMVFDLP